MCICVSLGNGVGLGEGRVSNTLLIYKTHFQLSIIRLMWQWHKTKPSTLHLHPRAYELGAKHVFLFQAGESGGASV